MLYLYYSYHNDMGCPMDGPRYTTGWAKMIARIPPYRVYKCTVSLLLNQKKLSMQSWKFKKIEKFWQGPRSRGAARGPLPEFFDFLKFPTLH